MFVSNDSTDTEMR